MFQTQFMKRFAPLRRSAQNMLGLEKEQNLNNRTSPKLPCEEAGTAAPELRGDLVIQRAEGIPERFNRGDEGKAVLPSHTMGRCTHIVKGNYRWGVSGIYRASIRLL